MTTTAVGHVGAKPNNSSAGRPRKSKTYQAPTLVKGAILSAVTASDTQTSGVTTDA
jgi:hypothetical protein